MAVNYLTKKVYEIKRENNSSIAVVVPTDSKTKIFPDELRESIPNSYKLFKEITRQVNNSMLLFSFEIPGKDISFVFPMCIEEKMIDYDKFFNSLEIICEMENYDCIYIPQLYCEEYLSSFEGFEYDIESEYRDDDCKIVIVNKEGERVLE